VRLDVELPEGLDQRGADGVMAAAGAKSARSSPSAHMAGEQHAEAQVVAQQGVQTAVTGLKPALSSSPVASGWQIAALSTKPRTSLPADA
jgi:hypothetical protein